MIDRQKAALSAYLTYLEEKKMKRSVAFLLMLVLVLSLVPGVAAAERETVTALRADFDEPVLSTSVLLNALETQKPAEGEEYFFFMPTF